MVRPNSKHTHLNYTEQREAKQKLQIQINKAIAINAGNGASQ